MALRFEVQHTAGLSRLGTLTTPHGAVETPALMPVLNPNLELISASEMARDFGVQMVITNSYIIRREERLRSQALEEGVHGVLSWDGPVMTDSGTFQDYVYGDRGIDPHEIVAFQREMGSDVGTILDIFSTPDRSHEQALEDLTETTERAKQTVGEAGDMALALPVQGSVYPDLRQQAAGELAQVAPHGGAVHPIGGVVPLMEDQRYQTLAQIILGAKRGLHPGRAVHLFGAGHPHMLALAVYLGCDLFDSAAYAKFAQGDRLLFPWGTEDLADLDELPCTCSVCRRWTPAELRSADKRERLDALARHNLWTTTAELRRIRQAQRRGRLFDLVLQRATGHARLMEVLTVLHQHVDQLEREEPLSYEKALNLTPPYHVARPQVKRARDRLFTRIDPKGPFVLLGETRRPFAENAPHAVAACLDAGLHPFFPSRLGPVPFELDSVYPFTQSLEPALLDGDESHQQGVLIEMAAAYGQEIGPVPEDLDGPGEVPGLNQARVRGTVAYQFGPTTVVALLDGELALETSKRTGKVRTVHADGEHILSLRAHDGLFTLKLPGARRLHAAVAAPGCRLVVTDESAPYNAEGKSVMGGFVLDVDENLRPGDECLVVDPEDRLLGVGQLRVSGPEALHLTAGMVAKVREGVGGDYGGRAPGT